MKPQNQAVIYVGNIQRFNDNPFKFIEQNDFLLVLGKREPDGSNLVEKIDILNEKDHFSY